MEEQTAYESDESLRYKNEHSCVCHELQVVFNQKNEGYGDSFSRTFNRWGLISAVVRITDKFNRLESLTERNGLFEDIEDTLMDMANYCIMTIAQLRMMRSSLEEEGFGNDGNDGVYNNPGSKGQIRCKPSDGSQLD